MKIAGFKKMLPRTYRPTPILCERSARAKFQQTKKFVTLFSQNSSRLSENSIKLKLFQECRVIKPRKNVTALEVKILANWGKCENSPQKWSDYVKITPQNSTDYVKSAY